MQQAIKPNLGNIMAINCFLGTRFFFVLIAFHTELQKPYQKKYKILNYESS